MLGQALLLFRWRHRGKTSAEQFEPIQRRLRQAVERGSGQQNCSRTRNTCANLLRLWPALWGFLTLAGVEPTNNAAERAIRSLVIKRKISGPTRSRRGEEFIARGFSAAETCRRQGRDLWDYMTRAVRAWLGNSPHPSLMPVPGG